MQNKTNGSEYFSEPLTIQTWIEDELIISAEVKQNDNIKTEIKPPSNLLNIIVVWCGVTKQITHSQFMFIKEVGLKDQNERKWILFKTTDKHI